MRTGAPPPAAPVEQPQFQATPAEQPPAEAAPVVSAEQQPETIPPPVQPPQWHEKPPFTVALPTPFSDADILQFLARSYAAGRSDGPEVAMARSLLSSPVSQATAQWLLSRSGVPLSFQWYMEFRKSAPSWPQSAVLNRRTEIALLTTQMPDAEKARYLTDNPPLTSTGRIFMGKYLLDSGHKQEALEMIRPVWTQERLLETTERQIRSSYSGLLTQQDHRARMIFLMSVKNWDAALRAAKDAGDGAEALVKTRMAVIGASKKAQKDIEALPKAVQNDSLAAYSRFLLAARQKKLKESADILVQLTSEQNAPPLAVQECRDWRSQQRILVRTLIDSDDFDKAYQAASAALSKRGCIHNDADFLAGWIALRFINRPEDAKKHFEALAANAETDSQKARAAYWLGRVSERLGDRQKAEQAYKQAAFFWNSFYGQVAAQALGSPTPRPSRQEDIAPELQQELESSLAWQAIRLMEAGGADELAIPLYSEMASSLPDERHVAALAGLAARMKNARAVVIIARIAARRGFNLGTSGYPTFGLPEIPVKNGKADQTLLYAIAHQESAFYARAKSSAGALGLMQLMPGTARMTATRYGLVYDADRLTLDPEYNVRLGLAHFSDLRNEWKDSLVLSFAAYNAGGGNVKKWITAHGDPRSPDVDTIDWIERIPFLETRHYVQRLTENLLIYRHLMGVSLPSPIALGEPAKPSQTATP